jgi:hypothetical protein
MVTLKIHSGTQVESNKKPPHKEVAYLKQLGIKLLLGLHNHTGRTV